jgi:hypothetical protein
VEPVQIDSIIHTKDLLRSATLRHHQVLAFIEYYNRTMAKPFRWTYGKPLKV